jgi:hypothetical protein
LGVDSGAGARQAASAVLFERKTIKAFGQTQSFVAGDATNVQFMVKDSKMYASTGGWEFGHFNQDGTPGGDSLIETCSPCHAKASRDSVFTRYSR